MERGRQTAGVVSARPWTFCLLVVPAFAAVASLGIFFFAAFLALSVLAAVGLGLWFGGALENAQSGRN